MLGSVHAVTENGSLLTASFGGSQLGRTLRSGRVILVVGTQKIVLTSRRACAGSTSIPTRSRTPNSGGYGIRSGVSKVLIINREIMPGRITSSSSTRRSGSRDTKEHDIMATQIDASARETVLVTDARIRPMIGNQRPRIPAAPQIPYELSDPYILVHEGVARSTRSGQPWTPPTRTVDSTTSGMPSRLVEHGSQHGSRWRV